MCFRMFSPLSAERASEGSLPFAEVARATAMTDAQPIQIRPMRAPSRSSQIERNARLPEPSMIRPGRLRGDGRPPAEARESAPGFRSIRITGETGHAVPGPVPARGQAEGPIGLEAVD